MFSDLSEDLPESLKKRILKKWISNSKRIDESNKSSIEAVNIEKIIYDKLIDERAVELLNKVKILYPDKYPVVLKILYELINKKVISELDGYTVYIILNNYLNIPVKPDIRIKFIKRGKEVDLKEYLEK